jgi:hypothetical protein
MADYGNGRKAIVAELMADGDRVLDGTVYHRTSESIAAELGTSAPNIRQIQKRIRDDLGWQAQ